MGVEWKEKEAPSFSLPSNFSYLSFIRKDDGISKSGVFGPSEPQIWILRTCFRYSFDKVCRQTDDGRNFKVAAKVDLHAQIREPMVNEAGFQLK